MSSGGYSVRKNTPGGAGTVTSVAFTAPISVFNVTGSPVTTAGTLQLGFNNFAPNLVLASPVSGAAASPAMRALVAADIPNLSAIYAALALDNTFTSTGYLAVPNGTTAQQPGSPATGMIRYNTTTARFEFYNGAWVNYVRITGDTMTGNLSVPNINITTAVNLLDTTNKIALDVSAANQLRLGNGFGSTLCPQDLWFSSGKGFMDANGAYILKFPSVVASAVNYFIVSNAASGSNPFISQPDASGTNIAGRNSVIKSQAGTGSGAGSFVELQAPTSIGSGTTVQTLSVAARIGFDVPGNTRGIIFLHGSIPTASNYTLQVVSGASTILNGITQIDLRIANSQFIVITAGNIAITGDLKLGTVGNGLYIKQGSNATMGAGTLAAGTLVISNTKVTAISNIFLTDLGGGVIANIGSLYISARTAGTSFTVSSSNALDTSNFCWMIVEPA